MINRDGFPSVAGDDAYAGNAVMIVTVEFENMRVSARNRIAVRESVHEARAILDAAPLVCRCVPATGQYLPDYSDQLSGSLRIKRPRSTSSWIG
ncbi:hypothetical protein ACVINW_003721 [Bradyrhizobium sp. USDA 4461]